MNTKAYLIILIATALTFSGLTQANAQTEGDDNNYVERTATERKRAVDEKTNVYPMGLFIEVGGASGATFTINYDMRISQKLNGLGFRVGAGYFKVEEISSFSLPLQLNYLLGKRGRYFEMGAGLTLYNLSKESRNYNYGNTRRSEEKNKTGVFGTLNLGYRKQPMEGGFLCGIGITCMIGEYFSDSFNFIPYPYLSLGYSF